MDREEIKKEVKSGSVAFGIWCTNHPTIVYVTIALVIGLLLGRCSA